MDKTTRSIRLLLVCLLIAPILLAQAPVRFGEPFPLTNTRYANVPAMETVLVSNDAGTFLFWLADEGVRVTKTGAQEPQGGRLVLEALRPIEVQGRIFDVVWTGAHFLVAATAYNGATYEIAGQLLDANGTPVGARRTLVDNGTAPILSASRSSILLLYSAGRTRGRLLDLSGAPAGTDLFLSDAGSTQPAVASNGSGFAVVINGSGRRETTMLSATGAITAQTSMTASDTGLALGSDGADYLLVTNSRNATDAHLLRASGSYERTTKLAGGALASPDVAWNADRYIVVVIVSFPREFRVLEVDREARAVLNSETRAYLEPSTPGIAARAGRAHIAYGTNPVLVSRLPLAGNQPEVATHAALDQKLLAAASSTKATLVVWSEGQLRAGIRHSDGRWRERVIEGVEATYAVAMSDGNEFLLMAPSAADPTKFVAIPIDGNGTPQSPRPTVSFKPTDAVWTGINYLVAGVTEEGIRVAVVEPSGVAEEPVVVANLVTPAPVERAVIATDGEGFFVVWEEPKGPTAPPPGVVEGWKIAGRKLTFRLEPEGPSPFLLASDGQWPAITIRNGVYQAAWTSGPNVYERSLHGDELGPIALVYQAPHDQRDVQTVVVAGRAFVSWLDTFSPTHVGAAHRIYSDIATPAFRAGLPSAPIILETPRGELCYLGAVVLPNAPHYGSTRITMVIGDLLPPLRATQPPVAKARLDNRSVILEWSAPANAAGYRVEYRIGDGPWTEIERWFDPGERAMTFGPVTSGLSYRFRVRAWSPGGTGPYSNEAVPSSVSSKRRAVR